MITIKLITDAVFLLFGNLAFSADSIYLSPQNLKNCNRIPLKYRGLKTDFPAICLFYIFYSYNLNIFLYLHFYFNFPIIVIH